jgi:hypothetical protein
MLGLVVTHPFGEWEKGDLIADPEFVEKVLASDHASAVVRVNVPDPVEPQTKAVSAAKKAS